MKLETYQCGRCKTSWEAPSAEEVVWWESLAAQRHPVISQLGMQDWMKEHTDFDGYTLKSVALHFVVKPYKCCNCGGLLKKYGVVRCHQCEAVSYNFYEQGLPPLIMKADDGVYWYESAQDLGRDVESPDIEEGIYTVWDAEGQVLKLQLCEPLKKGWFSRSISKGVITATGKYDVEAMRTAIAQGLEVDVNSLPEEAPALVKRFCSSKPAEK
ncbi:hypothetical protein Rhal01_03320 [Rubritalea halochordaticola]|uniref:DUF4178 domain-containing protein n=1 Tax=Rubritalea halochordaticola TaxID=714537 RepID=A0ABP9V3E4_9BACT